MDAGAAALLLAGAGAGVVAGVGFMVGFAVERDNLLRFLCYVSFFGFFCVCWFFELFYV